MHFHIGCARQRRSAWYHMLGEMKLFRNLEHRRMHGGIREDRAATIRRA